MALELRTKEKMQEVLMDPESQGPENAYYMLRGTPNVTVWEVGRYGQEYIKTYGHYHIGNQPETYKILFGQGIGILQHRNGSGEVDEIRLVKAKAGDTVHVPAGPWGHAFVNVGTTYFITEDDAPNDASHAQNDYLPMKDKHGMAYYIVEENDEPKAVPNSHYQNLPEPTWVEPE